MSSPSLECDFCQARVPIDATGCGRCPRCGFVAGVPKPMVKPVAAQPPRKSLAAVVADVSGLKKCPYCAESVKAEAMVCRFCGREFPRGGFNPTLATGATSAILRVLFWLMLLIVGVPALIGLTVFLASLIVGR